MGDDNPFGSLDDGGPFGSQAEHPTDAQPARAPKKKKEKSPSSGRSKKTVGALIRVGLVVGFIVYRYVVKA